MNQSQVKDIVVSVLDNFGQIVFLDRCDAGLNGDGRASIESLFNVVVDANTNYEQVLREQISAKWEEYRAATINDDPYQNPILKTNNPIFTYRAPSVVPTPDGRTLVSVSIGFPFNVNPSLPRKSL